MQDGTKTKANTPNFAASPVAAGLQRCPLTRGGVITLATSSELVPLLVLRRLWPPMEVTVWAPCEPPVYVLSAPSTLPLLLATDFCLR